MSDTTQFDVVRSLDKSATRRLLPQSVELWLAVVCSAVVICAGALCILQPEYQVAWLMAALFLPAVLAALRLSRTLALAPQATRLSLARSLIGAGVLILAPLLLRLAEGAGLIDFIGTRRAVGMVIGLGMCVVGVYTPNRLAPFAEQLFDSELGPKLARLVGASLTLGGVFYALVWLAAPLTMATLWSSLVLVVLTALVAFRCVLMVHQHQR